MQTVYEKPKCLTEEKTSYCGGCGHGIINKLLAELIDENGFQKNGIICWPIGCSCLSDVNFEMDQLMCLHGRAPAAATGIKRADPSKFVVAYQGDGDMVSEGMAEIMHAAIRGEKFTVLFVNNAIYGMTGAQMAPTTLIGQTATTAPHGRLASTSGYPVTMAEIMGQMPGVVYSERVAVNTPANIIKTKKAMQKAFDLQMQGQGMTFVEILSMCPTGWSTSATNALSWVEEKLMPVYPLGVVKDPEEGLKAQEEANK